MAKTDKSKGYHFLSKDIDDAPIPANQKTMIIQDGDAMFHALLEVSTNFLEIGHNIFDRMPKENGFHLQH